MNTINQTVEILYPEIHTSREMLARIERAGRCCYQSDPIGDPQAFVAKIIKRGHLSVLEHEHIQVRFITDRGVTHELVRHRLAAYSQESTRYCNYAGNGITYISPVNFEVDKEGNELLASIEAYYQKKIGEGMSPQDARYFLPNGLKTEIVCTMNLRQWYHVLNQRTSKAAHPQIRDLMCELQGKFEDFLPEVFGE